MKIFQRPDPQLFRILIPAIVLAKSLLAVITTESGDFINIVYGAAYVSKDVIFQGPYTFSMNLTNLFYRLWLLIPVDHTWIYSDYQFIPSPSGFLLIFLYKLPLIISDMLTSLVIYKSISLLSTSQRTATLGALIWLLNPYLTIAVEMDGTLDIISTFLVVLATYLFIRGRYAISGAVLAIATTARFYPVMLTPFFALFLLKEKRIKGLLLMIASYFGLLVGAVIPFIAAYGTGFLNILYQLPTSGNKEFIWFFGFRPNVASTSGTEFSSVITVATLLALLILKVWKADRKLILDAILIVLVTYVGLSHFNRYYTIWVVPFLTMDLAINWDCTRKYLSRVLYLLFFLSAFTYNSIYWWFNSLLFIHEFTPQIGEMSRFICAVGRNLRLGDLASTFSQSILAGICIIYGAMVTMRNTLAGQ